MTENVLLDDDVVEEKPVEDDAATEQPKPEPPITVTPNAVLDKILARISKPELVSTKLKAMVFGAPGTGKTHFCASKGTGRVLLIDIDSGSRTLIGRDNVDVFEYVSIEQVEALIKFLVKGDPAFDIYDTVAFDTLSQLAMKDVDRQLQRSSTAAGVPIYKADWDIYGETTQRLRSLMFAFRTIDKNLIVTSHAKEDKDKATDLTMIRPDLFPKLAASVAGLFDIVGYLRIDGKGNRVMQVQPSKTVAAKTRVNLPKEIMNPTWDSINK